MSDFTLVHGQDYALDLYDVATLDMTGVLNWTFFLTAKRDRADPDSAAVIKLLGDDFTVVTQGDLETLAELTALIPASATAVLPNTHAILLHYDCWGVDDANHKWPLDAGEILVQPALTTDFTVPQG